MPLGSTRRLARHGRASPCTPRQTPTGFRVFVNVQPVHREWSTQQVAAGPLQCLPVSLFHRGGGLEIESVLKNQAQTIQKLTELRAFYLERSGAFIAESKAIHAEMDQDKPVEPLATEAKAILSGSATVVWVPGA